MCVVWWTLNILDLYDWFVRSVISSLYLWLNLTLRDLWNPIFYFFNYVQIDAHFKSEMPAFFILQLFDFLWVRVNYLFLYTNCFTFLFFCSIHELNVDRTIREHFLNLIQCLLSSILDCFWKLIHPKSHIRSSLLLTFFFAQALLGIFYQRQEHHIAIWFD